MNRASHPTPETRSAAPAGTVIVVTYNSRDKISACLEAILAQAPALKVVVIDNASPDHSAAFIAERFPAVELIANGQNVGFGAACNQGFAVAEGEVVYLVNPDAHVEPGSFETALTYLREHPAVGIVGGKLVDEDGGRAPSARLFPSLINKFLTLSGLAARFPRHRFLARPDYAWFGHDDVMAVDWVPGAFTAIRRADLDRLGGFDERFFLYFEEVDLCRRFGQGGAHVVFHPGCVAAHEGGASSRTVKTTEFDEAGSQLRPFRLRSECLYHRKHAGLAGVVANVGFEWLWHAARRLFHTGLGPTRAQKRRASRRLMQAIGTALHDTNWGRTSPQTPW